MGESGDTHRDNHHTGGCWTVWRCSAGKEVNQFSYQMVHEARLSGWIYIFSLSLAGRIKTIPLGTNLSLITSKASLETILALVYSI